MGQKQLRKPGTVGGEAVEEMPHDPHKGDSLKAEMDALLDEIDGVLEDNAEEFVRSYRQKGGE